MLDSLKAQAIRQIRLYKAEQQFTQREIATLLNTTQPRVSDMFRGELDKFSLDFLLTCVYHLGIQPSIVFTQE